MYSDTFGVSMVQRRGAMSYASDSTRSLCLRFNAFSTEYDLIDNKCANADFIIILRCWMRHGIGPFIVNWSNRVCRVTAVTGG